MTLNLFGYGLFVQSDIAIPGTLPVENLPPNIRPVIVEQLGRAETGDKDQPIYRLDGSGIVFSPPALGNFHIRRDHIGISLFPYADSEYAVALLVATALPALLWLRGAFMLHAAGVILPGEDAVTAIAGTSGAGKSTIASALLREGAKLVGDDSLCLTLQGERVSVSGLPGGLFLAGPKDRIFLPTRPDQVSEGGMLARILFLRDVGEGQGDAIKRIEALEATELLLTNRHRPAVPALLGQHRFVLQSAAQLFKSVPLLSWSRCKGELAVDPERFRDKVAQAISGDSR